MSQFQRLICFRTPKNVLSYGNAILPKGVTDARKATHAYLIEGNIFGAHKVTDKKVEIGKLESPLAFGDIKTVRALGLNYEQHAKESKMPIPQYPIVFYKPATSIASPTADIKVPKMAQIPGLDYECELVIVIGKEGKDIPEEQALDYVLGYTLGNDVSHREWQIKRGGGQWSMGKGFDTWAPMGPAIVSSSVIKDPHTMKIKTILNGKVVQESSTGDMIFSVKKAVSFLSQGTTLLPGDLIFTGTPQGVGMGRNPPLWLKDGDVVEMELEGVGSISNKVVFEKEKAKL